MDERRTLSIIGWTVGLIVIIGWTVGLIVGAAFILNAVALAHL
jgi:hypothetical protein